jgi:hypothetical protein
MNAPVQTEPAHRARPAVSRTKSRKAASSITSPTLFPPPGTNRISTGNVRTSPNVAPGMTWTFSVVVMGSHVAATQIVLNPENANT